MMKSVGLSVIRWALLVCLLAVVEKTAASTMTATCSLKKNPVLAAGIDDNVAGTVTFTQNSGGSTKIAIIISGFSTTDRNTKHGFHIHESDDMSNGCNSLGGHYNPMNVNHGGPTANIRHVGDLGNVEEDSQGRVSDMKTADRVLLSGQYSVLGRSVVVHQMEDDLGLGGDAGSRATGNAGSRLGCCIITESSATLQQMSTLLMAACFAVFLKIYL